MIREWSLTFIPEVRLIACFVVTLFVGSALLFLVQPLIARMVLPLLGGTPSVWNTCMVFFQALLLAGYAYAHFGPKYLGIRRHALCHLGLLLAVLLTLPLAFPAELHPPTEGTPIWWLLGTLLLTVGGPFFVLSAGAPLLQRWFSATGQRGAADPYFLYAASNLGSMLALGAYPLLLEPRFPLSQQRFLWSGGYLAAVVLTMCCAWLLWRYSSSPVQATNADTKAKPEPPTWRQRLHWIVLALVPSSLLLSVTAYLTTDIAAIPLLWVAPLSLYLLTFILVFAKRRFLKQTLLARWLPLVVLLLTLVLLSEATTPVLALVVLHLVGLLWICLFCHGTLAESRPDSAHLTEFYLWLSVGGVLGGLFNALLAPLLFPSILEYPLMLVVVCLLRPTPVGEARNPRRDVAVAALLGGATALLILLVPRLGVPPGPLSSAAMFGVPSVICYTFLMRPVRFGLGIAALFLAGSLYGGVNGQTETRLRSFFGVHRVTLDPTGEYRLLIHGNTVHGQQALSANRRQEPLTYYHRTGPIGRVFNLAQSDTEVKRIGVVGLGAGSLAAYAQPHQEWTFFEIDPAVIFLARDSGLFSFLGDSRAAKIDLVAGDALLTLARSEDVFDILVIDAFSSDAIPIHLLTREALALYRSRLKADGIVAFNVSNRYLNLAPVLAALASDAEPPLDCILREDIGLLDEEKQAGKAASQWMVLGSSRSLVSQLRRRGWAGVPREAGVTVWTNDYSNLISVFRWD